MPHTNTIHSTTATNKMLSSLLLVAAFLQIHPIVAAIPRQPSRGLPIRSNHPYRGSSFLWGTRKHDDPSPLFSSSALLVPRGGDSSTAATDEDDEDDNDGKEKDKEDEEDEEDSSDNKKSITSTKPLVILIKSNLDSKVLDIHPMELNAIRARNVESVKSSLARQLPGKPPLDLIRLSLDGRVLRDELLMDELLDDDDDEDDDDDATDPNKPALTLVLDMVPPVDPRTFGQELEDRMEEMSTSDLLDAYTLNEAAIWFSSQFVVSRKGEADNSAEAKEDEDEDDEDEEATPPTPSSDSDPLIAFQLRQYATHLKSQLQTTLISEKTAPLLEDPIPPAQAAAEQARTPQIKGDRFRPAVAASISSSTAAASAAGGTLQSSSSSVVGLKQNVQHYLNIVRYCIVVFLVWLLSFVGVVHCDLNLILFLLLLTNLQYSTTRHHTIKIECNIIHRIGEKPFVTFVCFYFLVGLEDAL